MVKPTIEKIPKNLGKIFPKKIVPIVILSFLER